MDERVMQLRIGLLVLFTVGMIVILLTVFGGQDGLFEQFQRKQVFHIQFPQAPGVTRDTPVQKSGIRIGRVSGVRLADEVDEVELDDDVGVVVTVEIDRDRKIFSDEICRIKRNLLGDSILEFVKVNGDSQDQNDSGARGVQNRADTEAGPQAATGGDPLLQPGGNPERQARKALESGAWLRGEVQADPIQVVGNLEGDLATAIKSVARTSDEIRDFVEKVSEFLGTREELEPKQERLRGILDQARSTMEHMDQLALNANAIIGDEEVRQDVKDAAGQLPLVIQDARNTLGQMSASFARMEDTISRVNVSLGSVERFAQRLDAQGGAMIERLDRSAETLELLLGEMLTLTHAINSQEGTLGRLIRDPELHDNLSDAVANLEDLTRRLRPVVENARVFSDKVARHPELLGVRGAIQQSPGTKGVPRLSELRGAAGISQPPSYPRYSQPP